MKSHRQCRGNCAAPWPPFVTLASSQRDVGPCSRIPSRAARDPTWALTASSRSGYCHYYEGKERKQETS